MKAKKPGSAYVFLLSALCIVLFTRCDPLRINIPPSAQESSKEILAEPSDRSNEKILTENTSDTAATDKKNAEKYLIDKAKENTKEKVSDEFPRPEPANEPTHPDEKSHLDSHEAIDSADAGAFEPTTEPQTVDTQEYHDVGVGGDEPIVEQKQEAASSPEVQTEPTPETQPDVAPIPCGLSTVEECQLSGVGVCGRGIKRCTNFTWGRCTQVGINSAEVCDGRDNDCDGKIDEDFPKTSCCIPLTEDFRTANSQPPRTPHSSPILNPNGIELAYIDRNSRELHIINAKTGVLLRKLANTAKYKSKIIAYHPNGQSIAMGGFGATKQQVAIFLIDAKTGALIRSYSGRERDPMGSIGKSATKKIFFSPDGSLVTALYDRSNSSSKIISQAQVVVWKTIDGKIVQKINTNQTELRTAQINHQNNVLATSSYTEKIKLWSLQTGLLLQSLEPTKDKTAHEGNHTIDFHPTKPHLITAARSYYFRVWDIATGKLLHKFVYPGGPLQLAQAKPLTTPFFARYSPDGKWVLLAAFYGSVYFPYMLRGFYLWRTDTYKDGHSFGLTSKNIYPSDILWKKDSSAFTIVEEMNIWRFKCNR